MTPSTTRLATRLVLPVRELADMVPDARITLLDPFLDVADIDQGVIAELRELFGQVLPFRYELGDPAWFPGGTAYLPPHPVTVLRRLMHDLRHAFPELSVPSTGLHAAIPHLTLTEEAIDSVDTPLEVHAREAQLLRGTGAATTVLEVFPFGTSAA